jgi:ankyrin repeat protein
MSFILNWRLRSAVRRGDEAAVAALISRGADVETKDREGLTCLMIAANRGLVGVMQVLLELGADFNAASRVGGLWTGFTPLMAACCDSAGTVAPVELLLRSGADPRMVDNENRNVLDYAQISGYTEIVARLRAYGVEGNT